MVNIIKQEIEIEEALNLRIKTLNDTIKDNKITFLESKINDLKDTLEL